MQEREAAVRSNCVWRNSIHGILRTSLSHRYVIPASLAFIAIVMVAATSWTQNRPRNFILNLEPFRDPTGLVATFNTAGPLDTSNPFFQDLGTNGRSCATCHTPGNAFGLSASDARKLFVRARGSDPLFAAVDGANCPNVAPGDAKGHSMLLQNGLFRIALPVPANAQFAISVVMDPYGCALLRDPGTGQEIVSVYRRPLPATNLNFLSAVMVDGRETIAPLNNASTFAANLVTDLKSQALHATLGHAQASTPPTDEQLSEIVAFESGLYSAQVWDNSAGWLDSDGAQGGPRTLKDQSYFPGINDPLGGNPSGAPFDSAVFSIFVPWSNLRVSRRDDRYQRSASAPRAAIAAGEDIFNNFPLTITAVSGLNDSAALGKPEAIAGTCTTCHDSPNVGDHSLPVPLDIGTSHSAAYEQNPQLASALSQLDVADLPIFEISNCPDPQNPGQTLTFFTSDPGRALITGQCSDMIRIKGPILRGLAARAPYFHNGAAANLQQVVNFYNLRFQMGLTDEQKADLVAFLNSL
ncbi:MAG TPA: hypothetical protein VNE63_00815 [Candidatus Acidoferrales bacterium]|nr:hypothetical protein [Candidatus Acidoferrales bacterium]